MALQVHFSQPTSRSDNVAYKKAMVIEYMTRHAPVWNEVASHEL